MTQLAAFNLVRSLSGSEKRFFKLYARRQSVSRSYLDLFSIIEKAGSAETAAIYQAFKEKHPGVSIHNTARYLVKVLTDSLVQLKAERDPFFQLLHGIMQVRILRERALPDEGQRQLKKIRSQAHRLQQHLIAYMTYREELDFLSEASFPGMSDRHLVEAQMKAKGVLKMINHIQDHHSLFELLKYRLVHMGRISSEENRKQLDDLMLSEMGLVTGKSGSSFASQKLHLLFQSFFFTDIGDYRSALKTFASLNSLFEQHIELLDHPPQDYLSALNGILDSLHMLEHYGQMAFYIEKVRQLDQALYPEYFRYQVRKTAAVYELVQLVARQEYDAALAYASGPGADWLKAYNMVDEEKQWELYFYTGLACLNTGNHRQAHRLIDEVMRQHRPYPQWLVCKATRLLNIVIYYEKGDADYLEYEVRSYKRFFGKLQLLKSELLFFRFIRLCPDPKRKKLPEAQLRSVKQELAALRKDRYERQLLKYFDITEWIGSRIG